MVPVVVDGYNLLYARGDAPSAATRAALVRDLQRWATARARTVVVVFDAWAGGTREERLEARGPVTLLFTRAGERADERIVAWVDQRREAVVVTSDRAVQQRVRRRGAAVVTAEAFAARLADRSDEAARPADADAGDEADGDAASRRPGGRRPRGGAVARWVRDL